MPKTATVRARIEPRLKREAEAVLNTLGLTSSDAITLFYKQIELAGGLPFPVLVPNKVTARAIAAVKDRQGVEIFESFDSWAKATRAPNRSK